MLSEKVVKAKVKRIAIRLFILALLSSLFIMIGVWLNGIDNPVIKLIQTVFMWILAVLVALFFVNGILLMFYMPISSKMGKKEYICIAIVVVMLIIMKLKGG
ncbi:MAG: hypothetical protein LBU73_00375 [Helicobacteraceae bacterium]|jgi:hypothetical protein|nr:hypothetical protein [Helicobacteraceae bacterium]